MSEVELGCGVAGHDLSCLCDVVITNPLPPIHECIPNGIDDLWMGREICELRGYCVPWTRDTILAFLTDLETFYDAYRYGKHRQLGECLSEMEPLVFKDDDSPFVRWGMVRDAVQYAMDRFNDSLVDIMDYYELSPQFLMDSLTTNRSGGTWDRGKVEKLEELFMGDNLNYRDIARYMGLTIHTVNGLRKYWVVRRERLKGGDKPAQRMLHMLAKETDMSAQEIVDTVHRDFGKLYRTTAVNKIRSRQRLQNGN